MHLFLSHNKSHKRKRRQHEVLTSEPRLRVYEFFSEVTPRVDNWINSKSEVTVTVLPREPTEIQVDNIWENSLQQDVAKTRHFSTALFAFYIQFISTQPNPRPLRKTLLIGKEWTLLVIVKFSLNMPLRFHNALGTPPLPLQFHIKEKKNSHEEVLVSFDGNRLSFWWNFLDRRFGNCDNDRSWCKVNCCYAYRFISYVAHYWR